MNERIKELAKQAGLKTELWNNPEPFEIYKEDVHNPGGLTKFAELIVKECVNVCDEVAIEADEMTKSKFVTDAGRMLHEGMWGGAQNCKAGILNRFGVE